MGSAEQGEEEKTDEAVVPGAERQASERGLQAAANAAAQAGAGALRLLLAELKKGAEATAAAAGSSPPLWLYAKALEATAEEGHYKEAIMLYKVGTTSLYRLALRAENACVDIVDVMSLPLQ